MPAVALMFTGAVLTVNGLALLGAIDPKSATTANLFGGLLNIIIALQVGFSDGDSFTSGKMLLFGFTYLWLAYNSLMGISDMRAFGWYCAFVAVLAFPTAAITFDEGAGWFGIFWLTWAFLWLTFFIMMGLRVKGLEIFAGMFTIAAALGTAMIPGYLIIAGKWAG